jgi:hypothetical protein
MSYQDAKYLLHIKELKMNRTQSSLSYPMAHQSEQPVRQNWTYHLFYEPQELPIYFKH